MPEGNVSKIYCETSLKLFLLTAVAGVNGYASESKWHELTLRHKGAMCPYHTVRCHLIQ
jgi:hypothetical protein